MQSAQSAGEHSAYRRVMQVAYASGMKKDTLRRARRRGKLDKLIRDAGGIAEVEALTGTPKTHLIAIQKGRRGVGDALAEKMELAYGKPAGWFDLPDDSPAAFSAEVAALAIQIDSLPPDRRADVVHTCLRLVALARPATAKTHKSVGNG